jgi:hypothetical protein
MKESYRKGIAILRTWQSRTKPIFGVVAGVLDSRDDCLKRTTMPFADFCPAVRLPLGNLSRRSDTGQISWGNLSRLPCAIAGSTLRIFDGYGLRGK